MGQRSGSLPEGAVVAVETSAARVEFMAISRAPSAHIQDRLQAFIDKIPDTHRPDDEGPPRRRPPSVQPAADYFISLKAQSEPPGGIEAIRSSPEYRAKEPPTPTAPAA